MKNWSESEISLLGTMTDKDAAIAIGKPQHVVSAIRRQLGITAFAKHKSNNLTRWSDYQISLLGKIPDAEVAHIIGKKLNTVTVERNRRRIPPFRRQIRATHWVTWEAAALLNGPDFYRHLAAHYAAVFNEKLTYLALAKLAHYSESRMQKWFTAGTAQQPLVLSVRHHLWLLGRSWGSRQ